MKLGIYGCGGFGREALEIARAVNQVRRQWQDIIFIDDGKKSERVAGCMVYTFTEAADIIGLNNIEAVAAIGEPAVKRLIYEKLKDAGVSIATLVHPSVAVPETADISEGTVIYPGAFLSCNVDIGSNTVVMPHANIAHDCKIGKHNVICGHANLGGNIKTGENVFIGLSACVKQGLAVGTRAVLSMGTVVIRDVEEETVIVGNPGRVLMKSSGYRVFAK